MAKILIRPLVKKDVEDAAKIRINGWKTAYKGIINDNHLNSLNVEEQIKKFEKYVGKDNFIVAVEDEKVLGFCRFSYDNSSSSNIDYVDCELNALYVHPEFKGNGIGTKLFKYVLNIFCNLNKKSMILWCLADNVNSINFYKHMGGKIKESKIATIGEENYKEVGIVFDIKELCSNSSIKV